MGAPLRVLIVEDSEDDTALLVRELERAGYEVAFERVETAAAMRAALERQRWDLVIADYSMPQFSGMAALALVKERGLDLPSIFVSGTIGEETAVAAMKSGAHDYLMKGNLTRLIPAVERELREAEVRQERTRAEAQIRHLAFYDALTTLPNRTLLTQELEQALRGAREANRPLAVLKMSLDHFRDVNNTFGHEYGDRLLQEVARRLRGVLSDAGLVARLGADEFAFFLPGADGERAVQVAQTILKQLEHPFLLEGVTMAIQGSIGVALYPGHGTDGATLLRRADVAMYLAKDARSGYALYAADRDLYSPRRVALMSELRQALDRNQFVLHYQPKVHLHTGRVTGAEALVRWEHPELGMIPPSQFITIAEQTGDLTPLTLWTLKEALRQCHVWQQAGMDLGVSVNLSPRLLHDRHFPDQVASVLETWGVEPARLGLEITENSVMADPAAALANLERLSTMGIRLSIDDFGTGYSSLAYLRNLPVHEIKIDQAFVKGGLREAKDLSVIRSIIELGHNLRLQVVAEGIETRSTFERLAALGCDEGQGYYIGRPAPGSELIQWMRESSRGVKGARNGGIPVTAPGSGPSHQQLSELPLFQGLSSEDRGRLLAIAEGRQYPSGDTILHEGDAPTSIFVLVEGSVKVLKAVSPGEAKTLAVLGPGESFGEMSVFEGKSPVASVVAQEPATVLILPTARLLALLEAEPRLGIHVLGWLLRTCCARLRELDEQITTLSRWWIGYRRQVMGLASDLSEERHGA